jgi:hypothetical protein
VGEIEAPNAVSVGETTVTLIGERLPKNWSVRTLFEGEKPIDLILEVKSTDGQAALLIVEIQNTIDRRDVDGLAEQLFRYLRGPADTPVVAARYLAPSVRTALVERGISYVDATGNMRIVVQSPALFISERGSDKDPWRLGRPKGGLKGGPAARVVRLLLDSGHPWRVRELIQSSGTSSGSTYRVLEHLQREALVTKENGEYTVTDWERLLRQWARDTSSHSAFRTMGFIDPRGIEHFLNIIAHNTHFPYAVTGSAAARQWASYAPTRVVHVYVSSIQQAADQWGLRPNSAAPNVILMEPTSAGNAPFQRTKMTDAGYQVAHPVQVAVDLLNGPGRQPAEGEYLLDWMKTNEGSWRD